MNRLLSTTFGIVPSRGRGSWAGFMAAMVAAVAAARTAHAIVIDWVTVGNPGNAGETKNYYPYSNLTRSFLALFRAWFATLPLASCLPAAGLALCVGLTAGMSQAQAGNVLITVNGTITSASAGMGYTAGQPVSFFWEINDYAPQTPYGDAFTNLYRWIEENADDQPQLLANVGGTGIGGTYQRGTGAVPWDKLAVETGYPGFEIYMKTDGFNTTTNNRGLFLNADNSYLVSKLIFDGDLAQPYPFPGPFGSLPNPTTFLSDYFGTYSVQSTLEGRLEASAGGALLQAYFGASSVSIAPVAPVPEIDPAGMGSVLALVGGSLGVLERRRRSRR